MSTIYEKKRQDGTRYAKKVNNYKVYKKVVLISATTSVLILVLDTYNGFHWLFPLNDWWLWFCLLEERMV